jgi:foldase protein PrsA
MDKEKNKKSTTKSTKTNSNKNKPKATKTTAKVETKKEVKNKTEVKEEKVITKKEEEKAKDKIKEIEEKTKKKNKITKSKNNKVDFFTRIANDERRKIVYGFLGGLCLGLLIMVIFMPDRIATLKDGTQPIATISGKNVTADELYEDMKSQYPISVLLDKIDNIILTKKYKEDDTMTDKVNSNAEYYLNMYKQYYTDITDESELLEKMGFTSYDKYLEYLKLDYRKTKYTEEYIEDNLTDDEIKKYYDENVFGDINCQHILVKVSDDDDSEDGLSDDEAKALAEEIIKKINDGTSWEDIQTEYKDQVTYEDLGYQSWDASLETNFLTAIKDMDENSFSKEPVKTSYGYHVIYKLDQKKAPKLKKVKDTIIENLVSDKKSEDENITYKALINLRKENKLEFSDTEMKEKYETYCKEYK